MDAGFQTIGNATLICFDKKPILVTDPWVKGDAYFGSWGHSHEFPPEQMEAILNCEYVWFSHGHPDHLNMESIPLFKEKKILLADHVGGRIKKELTEQGFNVTVLPDRRWLRLSDRIEVLSIADGIQDSIILVNINGRLIANINDAPTSEWARFVRREVRKFDKTFLLSLCCFGDVDMINYHDEAGNRIRPEAAKKHPLGVKIAQALEGFGIQNFVPFSSFHRYQRKDTLWINEFATGLKDFEIGFYLERDRLLPAFIKYDCVNDAFEKINPAETKPRIVDPLECGDDWSTCLEKEDVTKATQYFQAVEYLWDELDFINLRVGGRDNRIEFKKRDFVRGVTFEAPRHSLMTVIQYEIFDDILIGNFMKTTRHGQWKGADLWHHFAPYLTKYADNGIAKTKAQVEDYIRQYRKRSFDYIIQGAEDRTREFVNSHFDKDSRIFQGGKSFLKQLKRVTG